MNTKNTTTYGVGNLVLGLWPVQNVAVLDRLMGFLIIGYPTAIKVCKENKSCTYWHPFKNIHASVSKQKNKKINMGEWSRIGWVMDSVLALWYIVVYSPGHVKPKSVILVYDDSPLNTRHQGVKAKTVWLGIRIVSATGATTFSVVCCFFSKLASLTIQQIELV